MASGGSVAPKERVNIVYKPATGDQEAGVELPMKQLVVGEFTNDPSEDMLEDRSSIDINKDNFNDVLAAQNVKVKMNVPNTLSEEPDAELSVALDFKTMRDFEPDAVAKKVPEVNKLLALREALVALKGPLSNVPEFRKKLQGIIDDDELREKLIGELGLNADADADAE